ncbi:MAG: AbrB/MazE/SpoVT family DNA-binding domain-containing protein [Nanoarchaeota archaeon]
MADVENKLQRWGNSFGIVIPLEIVRRKKIREGEKIKAIILKKSSVLRETFGSHKFSKPVSQLMKEMDKELYNE